MYPGANILAAGKEDFESQNRKKLFSRIATGNWDAVIVTHSGFERIPLSRETQERFFKEQLHELEMIRREHGRWLFISQNVLGVGLGRLQQGHAVFIKNGLEPLKMAERGGFEPPIRFNPYNGLANRRFRPLSHLSTPK